MLNGEFEDLTNVAEFLSTMKFHVLNNRHVIQFVNDRSNVNALSKSQLKKLRALTVKELNEKTFEELQEFCRALFKEVTAVNSLNLSGSTRKELVEWANGNGRFYSLSTAAQRELLSVPGLRPEKPIVLYRGLLFSSYDLKERKRYDGQLEVGKGLKFLREIRKGSRIVDLTWERPSSWTTSVKTAEQFARFGPASSSYAATMQWLSRQGHIDGDLGFILSYLAKPSDVLIDMQLLKTAAHLQHGDEGEVILRPGVYTCRVHTKYTPKGEVDPVQPKSDDRIDALVSTVQSFADSFTLGDLLTLELQHWNYVDLERYLQHGTIEQLKQLISSTTKSELLKKYEELQQFYKSVSSVQLSELHSVSSREQRPAVEFVIELKGSMERELTHKDHKSVQNPKGKEKAHLMTPQQVRDSRNSTMATTIRNLGRGMRFTDSSTTRDLTVLAKAANVDPPSELHRKSGKIQNDAVLEICSKFLKRIEFEVPNTLAEVTEETANVLLAAERNLTLFSTLNDFRKTLLKLNDSTVIDDE